MEDRGEGEVHRQKFAGKYFQELHQPEAELEAYLRRVNWDIYLHVTQFEETHVWGWRSLPSTFLTPLVYILGMGPGEWFNFDK